MTKTIDEKLNENRADMGLISRVMGDSMNRSVFYLSPSELFSRVKRLDGSMTPRRFIDAIAAFAAFETHPRFMSSPSLRFLRLSFLIEKALKDLNIDSVLDSEANE